VRIVKYLRHSRFANTKSSFKCFINRLLASYLVVKTTKRAIEMTFAKYIAHIKVNKKIRNINIVANESMKAKCSDEQL
jgi:hypothetical protein